MIKKKKYSFSRGKEGGTTVRLVLVYISAPEEIINYIYGCVAKNSKWYLPVLFVL